MAAFVFAYRQEGPLRLQDFDKGKARHLLSYGGWVTISSIITPIMASADQMLIGALLGVTSVAHYAVPMNLVLRSQIIPAALARTLFPRLSNHAPNDAKALAVRSLQSLSWAYGTICATAIILTPSFFKIWVGPNFAEVSAPVAEILFLGAFVNGLAFIPYNLLQGQGRPDITGIIHAAEILPFLGVLWMTTKAYGIEGAAVAWGLRILADALILSWMARLPPASVIRVAPLILILFASLLIARSSIGSDPLLSILAATIVPIILAPLALHFAPDLRNAIPLRFRLARQ